jgi:sodium-dependent dicarboxylate transporter 2/3/5
MEKVALIGAMLLILIPIDWREREYVLTWKQASQALDVGLFLFIAVTMTFPGAFMKTGLLEYVTSILQGFVGGLPPIFVVLILVTVVSFLSQLGLQMPLIALATPITVSLIYSIGGNPLAAVLAVGMAAVASTYMVPVSTPVHVIPFSTGRISMGEFIKSGIPLTVIAVLLLVFVLYPIGCLFLKI